MAKRKPARKRKRVSRKHRPSTRRRTTRKKVRRRLTTKRSKLRKKRKPFGGYNIVFEGCEETLEQVFGTKPITPSEMTKILWRYIKKWGLGGKD